jgi:hypothetical protein
MRREIKRLRTWLGRVIRDVQRKAGQISGSLKTRIETAQRLYEQRRDSKNKLYALHAGRLPRRRWSASPSIGSQGDAIHAVFCGAGHNIRLILAHLRVLLLALLGWLLLRAAISSASGFAPSSAA